MQKLPLEHVTIVICDMVQDVWAVTERRKVAENLRRQLLDPNGSDILAAEMKAEEVKREKKKEEKEAKRKKKKEEKEAKEAAHRALRRDQEAEP